MIERLREALAATGHDVGGAELLDVLWLARVMAGGAQDGTDPAYRASGAGRGDAHAEGREAPDDPAEGPAGPGGTAPGTPQAPPAAPHGLRDAGTRRALYTGQGTGHSATGTAARPLRVPVPRALPRAGQLARALRPLRTYRGHPTRTVPDVEATVRAAAESGLLDVVSRAEPEPACDAVVLVDDAPSMQAWRSLVPEIERLLRRSGVFRTVHVRHLSPRRPRVRGQGAPAASTLTLLLTDGVHPAWAGPEMRRAVTAWRRRGPVAVLNPLPRRLWRGTALDPQPRPLTGGGDIPLPVLPLEPGAVASWLRALARPGAELPVDTALFTAGETGERTEAPEELPADRLIARFRGAFSPGAYRLAVRLAAVGPTTPGEMQLVRLATLPDSTAAHVAEVLVGGLLTPLPGAGPRYDFKPGVRELLASGLSRADALDVRDAVGRVLEPHWGRHPDAAALVADDDGPERVPEGATAFATRGEPAAPEPPRRETESGSAQGRGAALLRTTAHRVEAQSATGALALLLTERFTAWHGHRPGGAEVRAWERSLPHLARRLVDAGLGDIEMLVDYQLPLTSRRADVVLAGRHPADGEPSYVVVEMKGWREAAVLEDDAVLVAVDGYSRPVLHPLEQVRGYVDYLMSHHQELADRPWLVTGVAYLPNATQFGVATLYEVEQDDRARLYTSDHGGLLLDFLRARFAPGPDTSAADSLLAARAVPARQLMAVAAQEVRERAQFVLLDEQQVAYETVYRAVRAALGRTREGQKEVVVVTGGPGTGKSVIALSLVGALYRQGVSVLHATGSSAFTTTLRKVAGARKREVGGLFRYFNSFMDAEPDGVDVLVCDEAHRIRGTSANRFTPASRRTGRPQIDELIDAARVPVFLLDEHQMVRPGETGTAEGIRAAARAKGLGCRIVGLDEQFRSAGSAAYVPWVLRLLGFDGGPPAAWRPEDRMRVLVARTPWDMEEFLERRRDEGYSARITAGYCWPWTRPTDGTLPPDVRIGDWHRPWNLSGERAVAGAPPAALWATDPAGFGQIGSVYAAQGFEYDWNGVVIGPDLVWRDDRWVTDRTASKDPAFRPSSVSDTDVDRLIRNAYKVLLTRGVVGTVLYATDDETRHKLSELVAGTVTLGRDAGNPVANPGEWS
ncbi:DNA/RNA helicase domain-containing protein [Streptomyces luteocolor]|uniref:DNA/RNA helicase domain-containing protein n=1 Tax=Streptomyces luteocolor TaxID=285500 RepID=UPI000A44683D